MKTFKIQYSEGDHQFFVIVSSKDIIAAITESNLPLNGIISVSLENE